MAVQSRVSLLNYYAVTAGALTATPAAQTGWPATNVLYPQQPFVPWKTTSTAQNDLTVDFIIPRPFDLFMAVDVNYTTVHLFLDSDPGYPSPYAPGPLTVTRNPWNRRYTLVYLFPSTHTDRYLRYRIPTQATTDGLTYFRTGGLWAGPCTTLASDLRWDERPQIREPHLDVSLIGGGTSRSSTGRPYVELHAQRPALTLIDTPGTGDELGSWLEIDRVLSNAGHFAWYFNRGNTSEGFIFRKMNESNWNVNQILSEDELILHEVVGP